MPVLPHSSDYKQMGRTLRLKRGQTAFHPDGGHIWLGHADVANEIHRFVSALPV